MVHPLPPPLCYRYGILINPLTWITFFLDKNTWPCLALLVLLSVFLLLAVYIELVCSAGNPTGEKRREKRRRKGRRCREEDVSFHFSHHSFAFFCVSCLPLFSFFFQLAARKVIGPKVVLWLHGLNIVGELLVPCVVILALHPHPAASAGTMFEVSIVFMKLISYVSVNKVPFLCDQHTHENTHTQEKRKKGREEKEKNRSW